MTSDWWGTVSGSTLEQGDLISHCPVYRVVEASDPDNPIVLLEEQDLLVLTQSCDLENDKVTEVLVATVTSYDAMLQRDGDTHPDIKSRKFRKGLVDGYLHPYALLPRRDQEPTLPWSIVNFHHVFTIPKPLASQIANQRGLRLRLRSPYREHAAQAFARYIMRVGLPATLDEFETYSPL